MGSMIVRMPPAWISWLSTVGAEQYGDKSKAVRELLRANIEAAMAEPRVASKNPRK